MDELFKKLDIKPKNKKLYEIAFSHASYVYENKNKNMESYDRLEFLGDAVVELAISDYLYNNFFLFEGDMTKIRSSFVCKEALTHYALELDLNKYIKVGNGVNKEDTHTKMISDVFEALFGAIYLDLGFEVAKDRILKIVAPFIESGDTVFFKDYKSKLEEYMKNEYSSIEYETVKEDTHDQDNRFTIDVKINDLTFGRGMGPNKKEASQEAAKNALEKMVPNNEDE